MNTTPPTELQYYTKDRFKEVISLDLSDEPKEYRTELTFMQAYGKLVELQVRTAPGDIVTKEQIPRVFYEDLEMFNCSRGGFAGETVFPGYIYQAWFREVYNKGTKYSIQFKTQLP